MNMKTWILICLLGITLASCSEDEEVQYKVAPELSGYVDNFFAEASERGKDLPKNLIIRLERTQSSVKVSREGEQYILNYSPALLDRQNETQTQATVCFYLGKVFLNRHNEEDKYSFMNIYLQAGYDPATEAALWDELFN